MKTAYRILLSALGVAALAWCLPWLYSMLLPEGVNDPFVAYSPVTDCFIVSEGDGGNTHIFAVDDMGNVTADNLTKEERDALVPQTYFNQLVARNEMPDSIAGDSVCIAILRHNQWTFSSIPHDVNKRNAQVYPIMESMPPRFELEDPSEAFVFRGAEIKFFDIATNTVNPSRSKRFQEVFEARGVTFPLRDINANITTRKTRDEGYLFIDNHGQVFHMKMQGGMPYLAKVDMPDGALASHVYVLENTEPRHIGLVVDEANTLYVVEKEGHRVVKLPVENIDPTRCRISIYKTFFNWVIKVRSDNGARWIALSSADYAPLGEYSVVDSKSAVETVAEYLFPFDLSFTSINDSYGGPRIDNISWHAIFLNLVLALCVVFMSRRRRDNMWVNGAVTLLFGIYYFVTYLIIKD